MDRNKDTLARDILMHCRKRLTAKFPFFSTALYSLKDELDEEIDTIATDGYFFYYNPNYIVASFKNDKNSLYIGILHLTLHCLLRHFNKKKCTHYQLFDVSVDVLIYFMLHQLKLISGKSKTLLLQSIPELDYFINECNSISSSALYDAAIRDKALANSLIDNKQIFYSDNHRYWVHPKTSKTEYSTSSSDNSKMWISIYDNVAQSLSDYQFKGSGGGSFKETFLGHQVAESKFSYEEYLRRLSTVQEFMKVDQDSFDLMWYTTGLEMYGDTPIIEFNEYKEDLILTDFVLAIDTSGSCSGEIMENFLGQSKKIFHDMNVGNRRVNVTIIQCDDEITDETNLENLCDINEYTAKFNAYGFGGTSFIPVFNRIEELLESGQLKNMKGLIYLSDGYGDFPDRIPSYETIFVVPGNIALSDYIPEWVTVVELE